MAHLHRAPSCGLERSAIAPQSTFPSSSLSQLYPGSVATDIALAVIGLIVIADGLAIFTNPDRLTLHDRVFGTLVVNIRPVRQTSAELRAL